MCFLTENGNFIANLFNLNSEKNRRTDFVRRFE